jgi:hypothetical protein
VEFKADEDIHLPLEGLDCWSRVEWHSTRGELLRFGYFGGAELLVAPALRDRMGILRDEGWREE